MARTPSTMLPLGTPAPAFSLLEPATGEQVSFDRAAGSRGTVVVFICNHCPYVKLIADELARFADDYAPQGIATVAINSNDAANYPDDAPEKMVEEAVARGYRFPYLYDAEQTVAKAYRAACTPDLYLFDGDGRLVYRGQFDASRPGSDEPTTGEDLRAAADALLAGKPPLERQLPSLGCNIKWREGSEPDYFG